MQVPNTFSISMIIFLSAFAGTGLIRWMAERWGWTAPPQADRWHRKATALHGGIGFYPPFLFGSIWVLADKFNLARTTEGLLPVFPQELALVASILLGSAIMFSIGLWDDLKPLRPATKLLAQLIASSLFIFNGGIFPLTNIYTLNLLITYFWFIGITNAVNLLDNMDGLSSGVVILSSTTVIFLTIGVHHSTQEGPLAIPLCLIFIAALLGFWLHNRPPAAIFMGDSGSLFIGFVLAGLTVPSSLNGFLGIKTGGNFLGTVFALLIPSLVLAIPIFDTVLVTITRIWRSRRPSRGGRDHSSHRLVGLGLPERKAVWILYFLSAVGGAMALLMQRFPAQALPLFGVFLLILVFTGIYLGRVKILVTEPERMHPQWTPLVSSLLYKRHAAEVLLDTTLIILCFYGAYLLRFEGQLVPDLRRAMINAFPLVVTCCLLAFFLAGIYRGQWRLISISDLYSYLMGVGGGTVLSLAVVTLATRFGLGHSRSVYFIFGILLFLALMGTRLSFRLMDNFLLGKSLGNSGGDQIPVIIYGAGKGGKLLYEEILSNSRWSGYKVIGFIDDDSNRIGRKLCGLPVKKRNDWLKFHCYPQVELWISSPTISDERITDLVDLGERTIIVRRMKIQIEDIPVRPFKDREKARKKG